MAVTASMVKELREMTGAGMMDCKKALSETNGDMDAAVEFLRKNGQAKAEKKAGRIAAEGLVKASVKEDKVAAIVEVNSETDFVANNAEFQGFVDAVVEQALGTSAADMDAFMAEAWNADPSKTVQDALTEKISVIGEKLNIRRFEKITSEGCVVAYIHGGGRIGVLVEADTNCDPEELDYVIPGNDDAIRAVKLIVSKMADAVVEANQGATGEEVFEGEDAEAVEEAVETVEE